MRPWQVLIFIAVVMAVTGTLYQVFHEDSGVSESDEYADYADDSDYSDKSEESVGSDSSEVSDTIIAEFPVFAEDSTSDEIKPSQTVSNEIKPPHVTVDSTTDSRVFLAPFYASLAESGEKTVRVLHYGDSQIEEDRLTQQIREALQSRYGGRGVGLMPLAQTIPTRTVRQEIHMNGRLVQPAQGPRRYIVHGFKRDQRTDGMYGPMGQTAEMNDSIVSGSEEIMAVCTPLIPTARYDRWRVFADSTVHYTFSGDTVWLKGRGRVYGLSQESTTGVIVDNIPLRGCIGTVFTRIDSAQLATFYREQNVRLIIMQFGGNAIPSNKNPGTIQAIVRGLRDQVRYLRRCAPGACILFIGPSDMLTQTEGEWQTYPMVPYMDKLLRKMALEEQIAYFSLFRWMGGSGSMARWQETGLAGSDGVHFTRSGARKAGNAVAEWMLEGER